MTTPWSAANEWFFNGNALTGSNFRTVTLYGFYDLPDIRTQDITIPFVDGQTSVDSYFAEQIIGLGSTVLGTDQASTESNVSTLKGYFSDKALHTLIRNMPTASNQVQASAKIQSFKTVFHGPKLATVVIVVKLPVPGFTSV